MPYKMEYPKLANCPFCGHWSELVVDEDKNVYISCPNCHCRGPQHYCIDFDGSNMTLSAVVRSVNDWNWRTDEYVKPKPHDSKEAVRLVNDMMRRNKERADNAEQSAGDDGGTV